MKKWECRLIIQTALLYGSATIEPKGFGMN